LKKICTVKKRVVLMEVEVTKKSKGKIIKCAFCEGKGKDPFELLSSLATCQVCGGRGIVTVSEPAIKCAFCEGTGIHRDQRLTCTVCGGKGMVTIEKGAEKCPHCSGKGVAPEEYLPCTVCGGKGMVTVKKKK